MKWKVKRFLKNLWDRLRLLFSQPHSITVILLIIIAILSLHFSFNTDNSFLSSVLSNIFAGLITGIDICFISGIKSYSINVIENKIDWLNRLHKECLSYMRMQRGLLNRKQIKNIEEYVYDMICSAAEINSSIRQSQFNKTLTFNLIKYSQEIFLSVREKIIAGDIPNLSNKDLFNLFRDVENLIFKLNGNIVNKLEELKAKKSNFYKSII